MRKIDIDMLTREEAQTLDDSFDCTGLPSRFRNVVLGGFLAAAFALTLFILGASAGVMTAALITIVAVGSLEKATYVRAQMNSRSTIRKLVHRIEDLEGVPSTPDNAKPSQLAMGRKARERDSQAA